jgi:hypothetical protein
MDYLPTLNRINNLFDGYRMFECFVQIWVNEILVEYIRV